jgi:hypothetical protein
MIRARVERSLSKIARADLQLTVTKVLTNGIELIAFYEVSALVDGKQSVWCGCNVYLTDGERIVEQWIQQGLWWRSRASPTVNSKIVSEHSWSAVSRRKRARPPRRHGASDELQELDDAHGAAHLCLITLLAPDAVQMAWEAEGIVFWPTLSAIPDFSDTVRRVVIMSVGSRRNRTRRR